MLAQLGARAGENILNICCDSNEQTVALARSLGQDGYVLAIDRSYRALTALSQCSQQVGLERHIRFLYLNLDDLAGHLHSEGVHRVISGRALAQIRRPQAVFRAIRQALRPGGVFFFYGPARKDLLELRLFHANLRNELRESRELTFVEQTGVPHARDAFIQVEMASFECPLHFASPDALYTYWRECDLYEEELDREFRYAAVQHFQSCATFETAQRLIGIKATNE